MYKKILNIIMIILLFVILYYIVYDMYTYIMYGQKINVIKNNCRIVLKKMPHNRYQSNNTEIDKVVSPWYALVKTIDNMKIYHSSNETYTINDGKTLYLDLRANMDTIMYIMAHELAHMTLKTPTGFDEHNSLDFTKLMSKFKNKMNNLGMLKYSRVSKNYGKYNGII